MTLERAKNVADMLKKVVMGMDECCVIRRDTADEWSCVIETKPEALNVPPCVNMPFCNCPPSFFDNENCGKRKICEKAYRRLFAVGSVS
ncbi:MAG: hypothetical protein Ta2A_12120 [Treponemataceae bacterium]|nr:MAG: hypothetical protein Ta2A_12120 [Treponemataceae bacterium]